MRGLTRLVLDTNVWLDWLVFADPSSVALDAAHQTGSVVLMTDEACRDEWRRVLTYPAIAARISPPVHERILADGPESPHTACYELKPVLIPLPRCQDPDDQKFVALAAREDADCLITRDKDLLALRPERFGLRFRIMTLRAWHAAATLPDQ